MIFHFRFRRAGGDAVSHQGQSCHPKRQEKHDTHEGPSGECDSRTALHQLYNWYRIQGKKCAAERVVRF